MPLLTRRVRRPSRPVGGRCGSVEGGESGNWSASLAGPQRSAEAHSSLAPYAGNATFEGGGYVFAASQARPMPSNRYGDPRTAAFEAVKYYNPWSIKHNLEVGGLIYQRKDGSFGFTGPNSGPKHEHHVFPFSLVDAEVLKQLPQGAKPVADYHTHGDDWSSEPFSKSDDEKILPGRHGQLSRCGWHAAECNKRMARISTMGLLLGHSERAL
jgi:Domain of unknown function (DUF4329)